MSVVFVAASQLPTPFCVFTMHGFLDEVTGKEHVALKQQLRDQGINVSVSTQFSSRLDLKGRGLKDVMRASVHVYNTEQELDRFVTALRPLAAG